MEISNAGQTKPQHTPGPWTVAVDSYGGFNLIRSAEGNDVACCLGDGSIPLTERHANEELIASAPLLEERVTSLEKALERCEKVIGIQPCDECGHSLSLHFDRHGCEYERGDHEGGEGDHGPFGAYAMGPCCCKAENLSDDGNDAFLLLRDIRQMRILAEARR